MHTKTSVLEPWQRDILVRDDEHTIDEHTLFDLRRGQETWIWRSKKPRYTQVGNRVYIVTDGAIGLYVTYAGYAYRSRRNSQGEWRYGDAILVTMPVVEVNPPAWLGRLDPDISRARWSWRYDAWNLRERLKVRTEEDDLTVPARGRLATIRRYVGTIALVGAGLVWGWVLLCGDRE